MAEMNNLEDIKESFDYITSVLDSMRVQNVMNTEGMDKVLLNINTRLESLSNEENSDLIKVFLAELKRSLEERHNFVSSKFSEIETSFKELVENSENQIQKHEIKEVFEIIATNLNVFSKDFSTQKDLISEVSLKIEELQKDDSPKREILRNISVLKVELEKFSNGFESIIINLNDKFKDLSQILANADPGEALGNIKKDIENIFLSSNAVLSTLQVIDRKNRELEDIITNVVTKDDFNLEREQVAKLITQNIQITDYMNALPTNTQLENLTERIDTTVGVINALKNIINETGKQNQQMLSAQLDNLESKILNISTEDEFIGFRKELSEFAQEVIQSTNLMRADLVETNSGLKDLVSFLADVDIKNTFETFANLTKVSENNLKESIVGISADIAKEIEKNKNLTKSDINQGISNVNEKIESVKNELSEGSKSNLSNILEHIQSVINNIFSVKNALHIENMETAEAIDEKLEGLKEDLIASNNFIVQNSQENLENIVSNVEKVFHEIVSVKENLDETSSQSFKNIGSGFSQISKRIGEIKEELNQNSHENFSNILSIVDDFSQQITGLKTSLEQSSQENSEEIKSFIDNLSEKLIALQAGLKKDSELGTSELKSLVEELSQTLQSTKTSLEQTSSIRYSGLKSGIEELSLELKSIQDNFDIKSQTNISKIVSLFEDLSTEFNIHKQFLSESAQINFETVSLYIQNLNQKVEETKNSFDENLKSNFTEIQNSISILPETIKTNQTIFENEKKALIEENSKNIEEMSEKIQNLVKGIIAKENPFKSEVLYEFNELKSQLDTVKKDLSQANQEIGDVVGVQINDCIENLGGSISQYNEKYNSALLSLQNKLIEYFQLLQQSTQENDLKLDNSLKETSELKTEVQSILESLFELKEDPTLNDLSAGLGEHFEEVLENINQLEEKISTKNSDSLENILNNLEEKFGIISNSLKSYKNFTSVGINELVEALEEKTETLKGQLNLTGTDVLNALTEKTNEIMACFTPINESLEKVIDIDFEKIIFDIKNQVESSYFSITSIIKEDVKTENEEQLEKLSHDFENLNEKLNTVIEKLTTYATNEFEELKSILNEITQNIETIPNIINDNFGENEFLSEKFSNIETSIEELAAETKNFFSEKIGATENIFLKAQEDSKTEVLNEIAKAHEETETLILHELGENISLVKEVLVSISPGKEIIEEISQKTVNLQGIIQTTSKVVEGKIAALEENYNSSIQSLLSEVKTSFYEKTEDNIDDLKSFIEIIENKKDFSADLDNLKSDIFNKFTEITDSFELSLSSISVKEELQGLHADIKISMDDLFANIEEKFATTIENNPSINNITEKSEEIVRRIENLKTAVTDDITEKLDCFELNIDNQRKDFCTLIEEVKTSLAALQESYVDLSLNSTMEMSSLLVDIQEKINGIQNKIDEFNLNEKIDGIKNQLQNIDFGQIITSVENKLNEFDFNKSIEKSTEEITNEFSVINQKLDLLAIDSDSEIEENIKEIKQILKLQMTFITKLNKPEKTDNLIGLSDLESIKTEIKNFEEKLDASIKCAKTDDTQKSIKDELNIFKEDILGSLIDIFSQISFVAETEEIKDFIEEKLDKMSSEIGNLPGKSTGANIEINDIKDFIEKTGEQVKSSLDHNFIDILSSLDILHETTNSVKNHFGVTKREAENESEYSYTLQDIESDIAKVRLILKDISQAKSIDNLDKLNYLTRLDDLSKLNELDKLNEDIMSLSSRTNKILLNSDESNTVLKSNLDKLRNVVHQFENIVKGLDNKDSINRVEHKLENINNLMLSSVKSDKIFNQTFTYLAEWIDVTSESLGNITQKVSEFEGVKQSITDLKKAIPKTMNIEPVLDEISEKFDQQQEKINSLENKIEQLIKENKSKNVDIKSIVTEVLEQITMPEFGVDAKLTKKVDNIDKQLTKLNESIEKITSYVD